MSDERDIQLFVKKCRDEILPVLDENLIALIELVAELLDPDKQFPSLSRRRVSSRKRKVALNLLRESFDWTATDVSILGVLYESLLDSVDENASKQGRRRRGGIFYTPSHITEFLVRAALDACSARLTERVPSVLDPACGCGAFLIAAFRELCARYPSVDPRTIASQSLHGIDNDISAAHVARLSIRIEANLSESDWPDLVKNIREGDSLRDFLRYDHDLYHVVVGNPPYRNVKRGIPDDLREFCKSNYRSAKGQWDLAAPFVELALDHLLKPGGACGFIVPNPLLLAENYLPIREIILENNLVAFGPAGAPFDDPGVEASLLVVRTGKRDIRYVSVLEARSGRKTKTVRKLPIELIRKLPRKVFSHRAEPRFLRPILDLKEKGALIPLGELVSFTRGIECGKRDTRVLSGLEETVKGALPLLVGKNVTPFRTRVEHQFSKPARNEERKVLRDPRLWEGARQLLVRRVADRPIAAVSDPPVCVLNTIYVVRGDGIDEYASCAFLNSSPFGKLFEQLFAFDDSIFPYLRGSQLSLVPIPGRALVDEKLSRWSRELHKLVGPDPDKINSPRVKELLEKIDSRVEAMYVNP